MLEYANGWMYVAISAIPLVYIARVILRRFMKVTVNCWFCNENCKVPFNEQNGFVCPRCEQYNGFTEDGGYNKDLPEQRMEYMNKYISPTKKKRSFLNGSIHGTAGNQPTRLPSILSHNGLCHQCNAQQNLIQALINKFEPKNEKNFFNELNQYKERLYKTYPLCGICEKYTQMKIQLDKQKLGLPDRTIASSGTPFGSRRFGGGTPSVYSAISAFSNSSRLTNNSCTPSYARSNQDCQSTLQDNFSTTQRNSSGKRYRKYRYACWNSGPAANLLNIFTFSVSTGLFLSYIVQLQQDADVELFDPSAYLPDFLLSMVIPQLLTYSSRLLLVASVAHLCSLKVSRARRSLPDLVAIVLWAALIYLKWRQPTKDIILSQLACSSVLTVIAFAVAFLPRKLLHRKRPNRIIHSVFSLASTPLSQCSTASTRSSPSNSSFCLNNRSVNRTFKSPARTNASNESAMNGFGALSTQNQNRPRTTREGTPSRELGSLLDGLHLGDSGGREQSQMNTGQDHSPPLSSVSSCTTSLRRRRGPFDSMKRPVLAPPRFRLGNQQPSMSQYSASNPFMSSSRYVPSAPPSVMTSVSEMRSSSNQSSYTVIHLLCALIALISIFVNVFMFYRMNSTKSD